MPTKRLPTLELCEENGGKPDSTKMVLCQSTTILRFLATNFCNESSWYTDPKIRFKIDEFLDFFQVCNYIQKGQKNFDMAWNIPAVAWFIFQSTMNPSLVKAIRMKLFYKPIYQLTEPDMTVVNDGLKDFMEASDFFKAYYLQDQKFMCGDRVCIGDLIAAMTFEQVSTMPRIFLDKNATYVIE